MDASNPPAEPPMPTIGQTEFCSAIFGADFFLDDFDRGDLVPLLLIGEGVALDIALRFAAMRRRYFTRPFRGIQQVN